MGGLVHVEWRLAISNDGILHTQPLQELHLREHVRIIIMPNKVTPLTSADYMHMLHQPLYMIPCVYTFACGPACAITPMVSCPIHLTVLENFATCSKQRCHIIPTRALKLQVWAG